jgi:L-lysine 6-oxidase
MYRIHPAIGFARVGNSPDAWYLEPTSVGGLPTEIDAQGHEQTVTHFKHAGQIKRQAARFRIYRHQEGHEPVEMTIGKGIRSVRWSVHVANKKAAWYNFQELQGDVMFGADNSYEKQGVPLRNAAIVADEDRRKLIIDPGARTLTKPGDWMAMARGSVLGATSRMTALPADIGRRRASDPHEVQEPARLFHLLSVRAEVGPSTSKSPFRAATQRASGSGRT